LLNPLLKDWKLDARGTSKSEIYAENYYFPELNAKTTQEKDV